MDLSDGKAQAPISEESNILERIARIISSVRGAKPDYAHLAAELEPALPFDIFGIVLLRHDRQAIRVTVCQKGSGDWQAGYHQHPLADSMVERISSNLVPVKTTSQQANSTSNKKQIADVLLVQDFPNGLTGLPSECGDALCSHPQLRAILIAPLIAGGNLLGTLELGSTQRKAYADLALQRLIHAIARVLATAIEGAQVGGNVEIQDRQRAELKDVSAVLTTAVDVPMILHRIVTGITNALHVASAIVRLDSRQRRLCLEAHSGLESSLPLQKVLDQHTVLSEQTIIGKTLLSRQSQVSQDIAVDRQFPLSQSFATELSLRSIFCYPLITGQYVYGALLLLSPETGGFTPLKTDIFSLFAGQATIAIQNGILLQSAQERRRFQESIEQLERANQQNVFANPDELAVSELLSRLQNESMSTFGVSLSSILRFISDHLLTRSERHLQEILRSLNAQELPEENREIGDLWTSEQLGRYSESATVLAHISDIEQFAVSSGREEATILLQAADSALASTDQLREISAALTRALQVDEAHPQAYEHLKRQLAEPWFIVDLNGTCIYLNRAAEVFCGLREALHGPYTWQRWPEESQALFSTFRPLQALKEDPLTIEQALEAILPRMRQLKDVLAYLSDFTVAHLVTEEAASGSAENNIPAFLRCTIAAEPLPGQEAHLVNAQAGTRAWSVAEAQEPRAVIAPPRQRFTGSPMLLDSSPSDRHYQFIRHALYNEEGRWFANALHIHDITEQVRDEKNKSVLLASVSHDLRTPLTTIKAAVTGLLQPGVEWDDDMRREILEDIDAETDHLHTLVNALVEMSRIEMGALVLDKEWCDMLELAHTTLNRAQRILADFAVSIRVQTPLPLIYADYAQLERVLYNLLENAARHSPRHTELYVYVDVLTQKGLPSGMSEIASRAVRVRIVDQGPGVPAEERERIFKSFYSLDAQGNGLGLAICRGIVEAHQGRIWVEGDAGGGSCFVFVLPIIS